MKCKHGFEYENQRDCVWSCYHTPNYLCCYPFGRENGECDVTPKGFKINRRKGTLNNVDSDIMRD